MINLATKLVVLGALLIGLEKRVIISCFSIPKLQQTKEIDIIAHPKVLAPTNHIVHSSNIIMVWRIPGTNKLGQHNFNKEQIDVLIKLTQLMPPKEVTRLMEDAKAMSTPEFMSYIKNKEEELSSLKVANLN